MYVGLDPNVITEFMMMCVIMLNGCGFIFMLTSFLVVLVDRVSSGKYAWSGSIIVLSSVFSFLSGGKHIYFFYKYWHGRGMLGLDDGVMLSALGFCVLILCILVILLMMWTLNRYYRAYLYGLGVLK